MGGKTFVFNSLETEISAKRTSLKQIVAANSL